MKTDLYRLWLQTVEDDWDYRLSLQNPPNPYTFASKKKVNKHGYIEDLCNLAVSYKRRNRFGCWEIFYNTYIGYKKNKSEILFKNNVLTGSNWITFSKDAEELHKRLIYRKTEKASLWMRLQLLWHACKLKLSKVQGVK